MKISKTMRLLVIATMVFVMAAVPITSYADTTVQSASKTGFTKAWGPIKHPTTSYQGYWVNMVYSYNTTLINEDTVVVDTNGARHRGRIINGNGSHFGPWRWANAGSSGIQVRHSGSSVSYHHLWE